MRLTKRQLKRIIREEYSRLKRRGLIKEAVSPMDIEDLCAVIRSHYDPEKPPSKQVEWARYCEYYDQLMMDYRLNFDEDADAFLMGTDLEFCPATAEELCGALQDPNIQGHPMFESYFNVLYGG